MSSATIPRERALQLYRMILKELPPRYTPLVKRKLTNTPPAAATVTSSSQSQQSPLHDILRAMFTSPQSQATKDIKNIFDSADRLPSEHQASQLAEYLKAQRVYVHLLERYNPMLLLEDMERIRLTARRVGLDLPEEVK